MHHISIIRSSVDGYLGCFQFLDVMNRLAMRVNDTDLSSSSTSDLNHFSHLPSLFHFSLILDPQSLKKNRNKLEVQSPLKYKKYGILNLIKIKDKKIKDYKDSFLFHVRRIRAKLQKKKKSKTKNNQQCKTNLGAQRLVSWSHTWSSVFQKAWVHTV